MEGIRILDGEWFRRYELAARRLYPHLQGIKLISAELSESTGRGVWVYAYKTSSEPHWVPMEYAQMEIVE